MHNKTEIRLLPGERWWGGRAADGMSMPYGAASFEADLTETLGSNRAAPLLLSSKGRYVWSDEPFAFAFTADSRWHSGSGTSCMHGTATACRR